MGGGTLGSFGTAAPSSMGTGLMGGGSMAGGPMAGAQPPQGLMSQMQSNFQGNGGMEEYMKMAQQMQGGQGGGQQQAAPHQARSPGPIGNSGASQMAIQQMMQNLSRNKRFGRA